jgi:hypothetical protein
MSEQPHLSTLPQRMRDAADVTEPARNVIGEEVTIHLGL